MNPKFQDAISIANSIVKRQYEESGRTLEIEYRDPEFQKDFVPCLIPLWYNNLHYRVKPEVVSEDS